ncbi:hypothetical protein DICSQDRAFT_181373 [Dichomitus squalens LYAD-421 SS1]|uniref:Dynamitin-domain-containing protein n=2 Tax=Dichomitus squalens TaxID=114155 RepID=A0A4Q9PLH7_9APHY|nr:uncharacterized protein DICSQDRAFT_181373 [Dichomitus squalens LYAD-421 SS1]EJF60466.1 hypothetical protein DICSQDRAFT_181373 [Dichomitus squalens LYAD-421 SS1]TBU55047.1 hypothetical protein BD310DRAFT_857456 [Dichomitus squalens]
MSAKYANLPDIDTAPDVYETEDVFPSAQDSKGDSSDDESGAPTRGHGRGKSETGTGREELDSSSVDPDDASRKFRKAEKKHRRPKIQYVYPPSPTGEEQSGPPSPTQGPLPLSQRLRLLQAEVAALEVELSDPTNPLLRKEKESGNADPGELIRGMVDVKRRIDKISKAREGRGKLVSVVLGETTDAEDDDVVKVTAEDKEEGTKAEAERKTEAAPPKLKEPQARDVAEMDRRVGELEKLVGSSNATLDELSPLPPPLLPLLTRLNAQLTLLTQPRHIDSISRRIKLLNAEFERANATSSQAHGAQRRGVHHSAANPASPSVASPSTALPAPASSASSTALQEQLAPILTRLAPLLPHIPHILTRLRTLSTLHTSAAGFQKTLEGLEEEQRRTRAALVDLQKAVEGVEKSLAENEKLVKGNVRELEDRIDGLGRRVDDMKVGLS